MLKLLAPLLGALAKSLLSSIMGMVRDNRVEEHKSARKAVEKQLESMREGLKKQEELSRKVLRERSSTTPSSWNRTSLLIGVCFLVVSCTRYVYVEPYRPVPPMIERPTISEEEPFNEREQIIADYAMQLEEAYLLLRQQIIEANEKNRYTEGME